MFRASSSLVRSAPSTVLIPKTHFALSKYSQKPLSVWQPKRFASSNKDKDRDDPPPPKPIIDLEAERKLQQEKLKSHPSEVSEESTTRKGWENTASVGTTGPGEATLQQGLKHDIGIIQDTFRLSNIPRESHILGLAGTIPYFVTSMSTLFLGWDLHQHLPTGNALYDAVFVHHDTARYLLSIIEPLQLGYGAVIISFLGAIHWGLEYAEKTPSTDWRRTRFRYGMGVAASIAAWPTIFMPLEYGLTTQFMAFVALYFADSNASTKGWAPKWYGQYRFLLTAMVGLAIFISLIGKSHIEKAERLSQGYLSEQIRRPGIADTETDWVKVEAEEKKKIKKEKEAVERKAKQEKQKRKQEEENNKASGSDKKNDGSKKPNPKEDKNVGKNKGEKNEDKNADEGKDDDEKKSDNGGEEDKGDESKSEKDDSNEDEKKDDNEEENSSNGDEKDENEKKDNSNKDEKKEDKDDGSKNQDKDEGKEDKPEGDKKEEDRGGEDKDRKVKKGNK